MNNSQVAAVLAKIQLGDNREIDAQGIVLREWHESIGDLKFEDAIEAVRLHRRESTAYLTPNHIRVGAVRARDAREREERKRRPAIEASRITLDREKFEAETQAAIVVARAAKAANS